MSTIEVTGLRVDDGAVSAVNGLDLTAEPGEVLVLLGPNGATVIETTRRDPRGISGPERRGDPGRRTRRRRPRPQRSSIPDDR